MPEELETPDNLDQQGAENSAPPAAAEPDYKADLVKNLMATGDPSTPTDSTVKPTEPTAADQSKDAEKSDESAEPEAQEPDGTEDEAPPAATDEHAFSKQRKYYQKKLKQAEEDAAFGRILATVGADAGIDPDAMANWIGLRARINKGDTTAADELAKLIGYAKPAVPVPAAPPTPVVPPEERVYAEYFADAVKNVDMTEDAARAKAKVLAAKLYPVEQPPTPQAPQYRAPEAPPAQPLDPVKAAASLELDKLDAQYATKVPNWKAMRAEVLKTISEKHQGAPPITWVSTFVEVAREVQAKHSKPASPRVAPTATLRPSSSASAATAGGQNYKADIVAAIMRGEM